MAEEHYGRRSLDVALPGIPNTIPELRAPVSRVSPGQIREPYSELATNLDRAGEALSKDVAVPLAEQAAARAVTRDEQGNVQVERYPIFGDAALAFKRAVKIAAVAEGEDEARQRNIAMRKEFETDPEGYKVAAKAAKPGMLSSMSAAGPEAQVAVGHVWDNLTTETYRGLLNVQERRELVRAGNVIGAQIETTKNELIALANNGDTDSPDFLQRVAKVKALYGELVNNPRINYSREEADAEWSHFEGELRGHALSHDVAGKIYDQGGIEAATKAAQSILTDPQLNLKPGQRDAMYNRVLGAIRQRQAAADRAYKEIDAELDDIGKIAAEGYRPPPDRMAALKETMAAVKDPDLKAKYEATLAALPIIATWRTMSAAQLEGELSRLSAQMREKGTELGEKGTAQGIALLKAGDALLTTMRKKIGDDPLGWADRTGTMPVPPIDFAGPNAAADIRGRIAAAETIAKRYGIAPTYLKPEERRVLETVAAEGGPNIIGLAQAITAGFGSRAQKVLAEVSKESPTLAHIGGLLTGSLFGGGSTTFTNDVADAVARRQDPEAAKTLPHWAKAPSDKLYNLEATRRTEQYGDAFLMVPNNGRAAEDSARAAFMTRALRQGLDPLTMDASGNVRNVYNRALQEAAGATFAADGTQFGGVVSWRQGSSLPFLGDTRKVIIPGNIRADRFGDVIAAITDDDLRKLPISPESASGKPYSAADLRGSVPVAVPGGYRFALGDPASDNPKWIRGADGNPFVLDLEKMEPTLRNRVRGAYTALSFGQPL